jgi:predicted nucleic acid-binding protein
MKDRFFLDTNIFVYTFDSTAPDKQSRCQQLVKQGLETGQGVISFQVVQEFVNVATRKFKVTLRISDCRLYLESVLSPLLDGHPHIELCSKALEIVERHGFSFYDSLIVASAVESGCSILYSEDLHHGQNVQGTTIRNPFNDR